MVSPAWLHPKEPDDDEIELVLRKAGLQEFKPMFFPGIGEEALERTGGRRRPPERTRQKWVGPYFVKMEARGDNCNIKLYIYIFKSGSLVLKGTWSGYDLTTCQVQFERTVESAQAAIVNRGWKK
jgi:hypothetical protein